MLKYLVVAFLAYYGHHLYTNHTHYDVLVHLEAGNNIDIEALKLLTHTHTVYRTKAFGQEKKWNYAVLAKGFLTEEIRRSYISAIKHFTFVKDTEAVRLYADPATYAFSSNLMIKAAKIWGTLFGGLLSRPLEKQSPPAFKCDLVELSSPTKPIFLYTFLSLGDNLAMQEFSKKVMLQVFPALDMRFVYSGKPEVERFSVFNIQFYDSVGTFCEYVESKFLDENTKLLSKAFPVSETYSAVEI